MGAIDEFISRFPNVTEDLLRELSRELKGRNEIISSAIDKAISGDKKSAILILKNLLGSYHPSSTVGGVAMLLTVKFIHDDINSSGELDKAKTIPELNTVLRRYDTVLLLLKGAKDMFKLPAKRFCSIIADHLMREGISTYERTGNALLASLLLKYALKFAESCSDEVMIGKVKYNLALVLMKLGKREEPKRFAMESYRIFKRLAHIEKHYEKNMELAKKLCEKLNCVL